MKHVGAALKGATNACIGIATWGIVRNAETLTETCRRCSYGDKIRYGVNTSMVGRGAYLDHNHTHFLLVDDGSKDIYGKEILFRAELEKYIIQKGKCILVFNPIVHGGSEVTDMHGG